ncbi:MAG: NUDIX domain-containing protein [Candidatus Micrarchaeaceae archaeon]
MSNGQRFMVRAAVYVVIAKDDAVLMLRRHKTGYRDGEYTLPAGHVESNESFLQACVREVKEEVCLDVLPEDLELVHVMQRHEYGIDVVDYYFRAKRWLGTPAIGEPRKADDVRWVPFAGVDKYAIEFVSEALEREIRHVRYSYSFMRESG